LRSIRDGPAAPDPGAHNRLTVGRHLISNIQYPRVPGSVGLQPMAAGAILSRRG